MMDNLYLLVELAGQPAILPAGFVESVVEIDNVTPIPCVPPHVMGLFALRSRVLTVIDSSAALECGRHKHKGDMQAVIVTVDGHLYGLLVDHVEDVIAIDGAPVPPRALLSQAWLRMTEGVLEHEGRPLLLIDIAALIDGPLSLAA